MYWGYILYSPSKTRYYIGTTGVGLDIRLQRHNDGWTRSTKSGIPWEAKYLKTFEHKTVALEWKRRAKSMKNRSFIMQSDIESSLRTGMQI